MQHKRFTFIVRAIVWGLALWAAAPPAQADTIYQLNQIGLARYEKNQFGEAIGAFQAALAQDPGNAVVRQNLALALNGDGVQRGDQGDYAGGMARLEEALRLDPEQPAIRRNLTVLRVNAGTASIEKRQWAEADRLLNAAYRTAGQDDLGQINERRSQLFLLHAQELKKQDEPWKAMRELRKALDLQPTFVAGLLMMGDLYYETGDNITALSYYLEARDTDPGVEGLNAQIDKLLREQAIEGDFQKRSSSHFTVAYEEPVTEATVAEVLDLLDEAYTTLGRALNYRPARRQPVVLYNRQQYDDVTIAPDWSGALYDGKIRVPVPPGGFPRGAREALRQTLYHEYTHAIVHQLTGQALPAWFNEGLATYFELDEDARRNRDQEDARQLQRRLNRGESLSVTALPRIFNEIHDPDEASRAYLISRNFASWLAGRDSVARWRQVLDAVAGDVPLPEAFRTVYRKDLSQLEREWTDALQR